MTKLALLGDAAAYEPVGDQPQQERRRVPYQSHSLEECITHVSTPTGKRKILKAMVTTACQMNCHYCPFRAGRSTMKRLTFTPGELASGLDTLQQAGKVEGMFLSSGIIKGSVTAQDKIIDTAELVRNRYHFGGYLHLKVMPGIEYDQLYRLMQLANRVSVNLEGPTQQRLDALAPKKDFQRELLGMLQLAEQIRRAHPAEHTKNRRARTVPYSEATSVLYMAYLNHRRELSRARGPLFLSESRRNHAQPTSIWTWSKAVEGLAEHSGVHQFTTHTPRHLCLTDLARAGWDLHEIATFAGHRSIQSTLLYIHLSGRELSAKLAQGMAEIHAWRVSMLREVLA